MHAYTATSHHSMTPSELEIITKRPSECSPREIDVFIDFVREGGEVQAAGLRERVTGAAALAFARLSGSCVGVAALKLPQPNYRERIHKSSGILIPETAFPFELGWVFVSMSSRGKGYARLLSSAALAEGQGDGVFATSRADNAAMHRSLVRAGFEATGEPFRSSRGPYSLQIFLRHASRPATR